MQLKDKKTKVLAYVCESSSIKKSQRKEGGSEFLSIVDEKKAEDKILPKIFYITITEYVPSIYSKNRDFGEVYYELRQIDENKFQNKLTINVWPPKEEGFTEINSLKNGYDAFIKKDGEILRRNTEQIDISDAIINARMWDFYLNLDTLINRKSYPSAAVSSIRNKFKDVLFPYEYFDNFKLNRIGGNFYFESIRFFGYEKNPDTRRAERLTYYGQCHPSANF
jgi:hypothetical protein